MTVLADLDDTIRELLVRTVPLDPTEVELAFDTPDRDWSGRLTRPAVNCFLFDLRENLKMRTVGWEVKRSGENNLGSRQRAPLRIDATYQVTTWARAPEDEHRLLWRVLAALVKSNPLPRDLLRGGLVDQPGPVTTSVAQPDQMPSNFADLWQGLENRVRPGLTYVVTLVLDPEVAYQAPLVLRAPQIGIRQITPDDARSGFDVRGWVRNRDNVVEGLPGVVVMVEETGARTTTDEQGWFRLPAPRRGSAVLVLRAQDRTEAKVSVTIPGEDVILEL